jgi:hypothetical protein
MDIKCMPNGKVVSLSSQISSSMWYYWHSFCSRNCLQYLSIQLPWGISTASTRIASPGPLPFRRCDFDWPESRFRSSNLLLALASTVVLGFGPRRDPWPNFCSFQDNLYVWRWSLLSKRLEFVFLNSRQICCIVISHECTRTHSATR